MSPFPALELFGQLGQATLFPGRSLENADILQTDALVVRSVTKIDANLLQNTAVRFVGTATSGIDHVDSNYLKSRGIHFADAAGCNSRAVAEYVLAAIVFLADCGKIELTGQTIGIIGCGRIGSIVSQLCKTLGMTVLHNDPPLAAYSRLSNHLELNELLPQCDLVTMHVPFTTSDDDSSFPTQNMVDGAFLAKMKRGAVLINAARGEIVDRDALVAALDSGRIRAVLDVWPREPDIDAVLASLVEIATPHVAGYSLQAKRRATAIIARAMAHWAGETAKITGIIDDFESAMVTAPALHPAISIKSGPPGTAISRLLSQVCALADMDGRLRAAIKQGRVVHEFDRIRADYAARREWSSIRVAIDVDVAGDDEIRNLRDLSAELGFQVD